MNLGSIYYKIVLPVEISAAFDVADITDAVTFICEVTSLTIATEMFSVDNIVLTKVEKVSTDAVDVLMNDEVISAGSETV